MKHDEEASALGSNIFVSDHPKNIDLTCLEAVVFWYKEIEKYDFSNPDYSDATGNCMSSTPRPVSSCECRRVYSRFNLLTMHDDT